MQMSQSCLPPARASPFLATGYELLAADCACHHGRQQRLERVHCVEASCVRTPIVVILVVVLPIKCVNSAAHH